MPFSYYLGLIMKHWVKQLLGLGIIWGYTQYLAHGQMDGYAVLANGEKVHFGQSQWQVEMAQEGGHFRFKVDLKDTVIVDDLVLHVPMPSIDQPQYFCSNGFQSWSISKEYPLNGKIAAPNPLIRPYSRHYGDWEYAPRNPRPRLFGWTWGWIRGEGEAVSLIFSCSDQQAFSCIIPDLEAQRWEIHRDFKGRRLAGRVELGHFWVKKGRLNDLKDSLPVAPIGPRPKLWGWTSWYNFYTKISEELILDQLRNVAAFEKPLDIFQIDDGFQAETGDWLQTNDKFPNGMKALADSIHASGMKAGLWLAPFVVSHTSSIAKQHPEWLVKDAKGKPMKAGVNPGWGGKYYALDIYQPEAANYIRQVCRTMVEDWGFDLLKVDFLFAACMVPRPDKTRAEIMTDAIALLREAVGDQWLLGCGTPLAPGFGQFDYCRIGPDIHLKWEFKMLDRLHARERPDTKGAIQNTCSRWLLDGKAWANDPDVYILRNENQRLTWDQKAVLFQVNALLGQVVFSSDDFAKLSPMATQQHLLPMMGTEIRVESVEPVGEMQWRIWGKKSGMKTLWLVNAAKKTFSFEQVEGYSENWRQNIGKVEGWRLPGFCIREMQVVK